MKRLLGCLVLLLASTQLLLAGPVKNNDIDLNLDMVQCLTGGPPQYCNFDPGWGADGGPASGWANFSLIDEPYSFNFETGSALSWTYDGNNYSAVFGYGGFFDMVGPDGLTFTGVVTSGTSGWFGVGSGVNVNYFGQWSNGEYADGTAYITFNYDFVTSEADLTSHPAPEPSSLFLLGSGALGLLGLRRKLC